ncbi:MAG: hypothetical protein ACOYT7_02135 [Patescibacteria group bacterium]
MKITAHILTKNEARFIWYSVMSVIKYVDRVRLWDTGSTDGTLEIIEEIAKTREAKAKEVFQVKKLSLEKFREGELRGQMLGEDVDSISEEAPAELAFSLARQKMLEATSAPWFIVVDADEIWWEESIKKLTDTIRERADELESIVVPTINPVGDVFHYQEREAGRYYLAGRVGHLNLRAVNRAVPGLASRGRHGTWGWVDSEGKMIQDRDPKKILYLDTPYLHATHLKRAGKEGLDQEVIKRAKKLKYELGIPFPRDFYYPEVFFRPRPEIVPSPWGSINFPYKFRAFFETPLKKIYRRTILPFEKHGY